MTSSDSAGLPQVGRITLTSREEKWVKAVLTVVGVLYVVLLVVVYQLVSTALHKAGEPAWLARGIPLGLDFAGTVDVALSLALALKDSRGQFLVRAYGLILVTTSAGIGAWYGHVIGHGWQNWFVVAHALIAITLFVYAEAAAWLVRARIDRALNVPRVPLLLLFTNPRIWRQANIARLRHRSPVSVYLVRRDERLKAIGLVLEEAQRQAGYKGAKAEESRRAILRAVAAGLLPADAITRACEGEKGLGKKGSRQLVVDSAKALMLGGVSADAEFAHILDGPTGKIPERSAMALTWEDFDNGKDPGNAGGGNGQGRKATEAEMIEWVRVNDRITGKSTPIKEIAGKFGIRTSSAQQIRNRTPKAHVNGHRHH